MGARGLARKYELQQEYKSTFQYSHVQELLHFLGCEHYLCKVVEVNGNFEYQCSGCGSTTTDGQYPRLPDHSNLREKLFQEFLG